LIALSLFLSSFCESLLLTLSLSLLLLLLLFFASFSLLLPASSVVFLSSVLASSYVLALCSGAACFFISCFGAAAYVLISPQSFTSTFSAGLSWLLHLSFSILWQISNPFSTLPKTTCFPLRWGVYVKVTKNCEPLVFFPALAIDNNPLVSCFNLKFSSGNVLP
jgi:hypothetical protein